MTVPSRTPAADSRLRVGVVGAGRVGATLGAALDAVGHRVVAASGTSEATRLRAATLLPHVPLRPVEEVVEQAELLLLTVPSRELPALVEGLTRRGLWQAGQIVIHTDPRRGVEVFDPARAAHVLPIAWHPAMRFTGTPMDLERLGEASFAVTAPEPLRPIGEALVIEIGAEPVWVEPADRAVYGAAVTHAAAHFSVLVDQAAEALEGANVAGGRRLLATWMLTALEEALRGAAPAAGTPGALADEADLRHDLALLDGLSADSGAVYLAMTRAAAARAFSEGRIGQDRINRLIELLGTSGPAA